MKTRMIMSAAAICALTFVQAQEGSKPDQPPVAGGEARDPAPQKSAYHECLVVAGPNTWKVIGLDEQQTSRVLALQARYKEQMNPPQKEEEKKGRVKKDKAAKDKATPEKSATNDLKNEGSAVVTPKLEPVPPVNTKVEEPAMKSEKDDVVGSTLDPLAPQPQASIDEELRSILTPAQLAWWDKQCAHTEPTGAVTPQE